MKESEMEEIINGIVNQLRVKKDEPYIVCGTCGGGKRYCPHRSTYELEEGSPVLCYAFPRPEKYRQLCVLEFSNHCEVWNRIKREWGGKK